MHLPEAGALWRRQGSHSLRNAALSTATWAPRYSFGLRTAVEGGRSAASLLHAVPASGFDRGVGTPSSTALHPARQPALMSAGPASHAGAFPWPAPVGSRTVCHQDAGGGSWVAYGGLVTSSVGLQERRAAYATAVKVRRGAGLRDWRSPGGPRASSRRRDALNPAKPYPLSAYRCVSDLGGGTQAPAARAQRS